MIDLLHTIDCPLPGHGAIKITVNLGYTDAQIIEGWARGENLAVVGFPEWEKSTAALGIDCLEPPIPLTMEAARRTFSAVLSSYLTGYGVINDALVDYMSVNRPFLKPR